MVQVPAPSRPVPGNMVGAGLLPYVLVSKFDDWRTAITDDGIDELPFYRRQPSLTEGMVILP